MSTIVYITARFPRTGVGGGWQLRRGAWQAVGSGSGRRAASWLGRERGRRRGSTAQARGWWRGTRPLPLLLVIWSRPSAGSAAGCGQRGPGARPRWSWWAAAVRILTCLFLPSSQRWLIRGLVGGSGAGGQLEEESRAARGGAGARRPRFVHQEGLHLLPRPLVHGLINPGNLVKRNLYNLGLMKSCS
jgi:hypothetical protein